MQQIAVPLPGLFTALTFIVPGEAIVISASLAAVGSWGLAELVKNQEKVFSCDFEGVSQKNLHFQVLGTVYFAVCHIDGRFS